MQSSPHGKINLATSLTETFDIRSQNKLGTEEHRGRQQLSPRTLRSRRLTQGGTYGFAYNRRHACCNRQGGRGQAALGTLPFLGRDRWGRPRAGLSSARNKEAEARGTPRLEAGPGA